MLKRLDSARRMGHLGDLDVHFAQLIAESGDSPPVLLAAALLSQLSSAGHVCLDLDALAEQPLFEGLLSAPPLAIWQEALHEHAACGGADDYTPLVLDGTRLYMRRYFDYECAIAHAWHMRSAMPAGNVPQQKLDELFPLRDGDPLRDQRAAAANAIRYNISLISGGPGTGKTTTLASILALLLEQDGSNLRILLAAPTGKAAARMQEAIRQAKARLPLSDEIRGTIPEAAQTLHRLLGMRPQDGGNKWLHNADNPLACDVLVVDEASMIDMALMARLFAALPSKARLILLGDRDQLASVDAGAVFADLCTAGSSPLNISFRFDSNSDIARLATALRTGDVDDMMEILCDTSDEVYWSRNASRRAVIEHAASHYLRFVALARDVPGIDVFKAFSQFRLLTPLRQGLLGVAALNSGIEKHLASVGAIPPRAHWYAGKPIMISANDYALRLFNGDIGICVVEPASRELRVAFPADSEQGGVRYLPPARLPPHETAWAMTVHKSQGSEFEQVALALPEEGSELITRELLYTAVTRARQTVSLWGTEASLQAACVRRIVRHSGLVQRLKSVDAA